MATFTDLLGGRGAGNVGVHTHDFDEIGGRLRVYSAQIDTLSADKITTGTISTETITLSASGVVESSNYATGTSGMHIAGSGFAEFQDVIVRGRITAETNSDIPVEFLTAGTITAQTIVMGSGGIIEASNFSSGSSGFQINASLGSAEFNDVTVRGTIFASGGEVGTLSVTGTLTMTTGGVFQTATSGNRVVIAQSDVERISFFTAHGEEDFPASIAASIADLGTDAEDQLVLGLVAPSHETAGAGTQLLVRNVSQDLTSNPAQVVLNYSGTSTLRSELRLEDNWILLLDGGTAANPAMAFREDLDTGPYRIGPNDMGFATGGALRFRIDSSGVLRGDGTSGEAWIRMGAAGTAGAPTYAFDNDDDSGVYPWGANAVGITAGGTVELVVSTNLLRAPVIYDNTDSTPDFPVGINSTNTAVVRDTSALATKPGWRHLHDLHKIPIPAPITWDAKGKKGPRMRIGYGADHWAEIDKRTARFDEGGDPAIWDYKAVIAIQGAHITKLERLVDDLIAEAAERFEKLERAIAA